MWEITTRKVPYEDADDEIAIGVAVKSGEREEIPQETPSQYAALIKRCWAQRRDDRPQIEEVLQELGDFSRRLVSI